MKTNQIETYTCEICGETYGTADKALKCESRAVTQAKLVRIGDVVKITRGEGVDCLAKVTSIGVHSMEWGHYQWEHYWHTQFVTAELINNFGSRTLTFDSYDTV